MKFKLLAVLAMVAIFSVGFVASSYAQLPDGIITMIELGGDTGFYQYNKDFAKNSDPYNDAAGFPLQKFDGEPNTNYAFHNLTGGSSVTFLGKKGNVFFFASINAWNLGGEPGTRYVHQVPIEDNIVNSSFYNATYTDPSGIFSIMVGKATIPFAMSNFNDRFDWDLGGPYGSFNLFPFQIKLTVKGFYLDFIQTNNKYEKVAEGPQVTEVAPGVFAMVTRPWVDPYGDLYFEEYNTKTTVPCIAVGYEIGNLVMSPMWLNIGFVYNQYKIDDKRLAGAENGKTIRAWRAAVSFKKDGLIPGIFDFLAHAYYGINGNQLDMGIPNVSMAAYNSIVWSDADNKFKDTVGFGGQLGIAFKVGIHKIAAGLGYDQEKTKDITGAKADKDVEYWGSFWYYMDSNFQIIPSIIYRDHMKNQAGVKQGTETVYGIHWQLNV